MELSLLNLYRKMIVELATEIIGPVHFNMWKTLVRKCKQWLLEDSAQLPIYLRANLLTDVV